MRLPIPLLLYIGTAGLLVQAGLWFADASVRLKAQPADVFHSRGQTQAVAQLAKGKGVLAGSQAWVYSPLEWWQRFANVNLVGKLPPPPPDPAQAQTPVAPPKPPERPVAEIIDLITLTCDSTTGGRGGDTHVAVRYKDPNGLQLPEHVLRQMAAAGAAATPAGRPADVAAPRTSGPGGRRGGTSPMPTPMPAAGGLGGPEIVHYVKPGETLWKPYDDIKLVRVNNDAESAYFVRLRPEGDGVVASAEEEVFKASMQMSQAILEELAKQRRAGRAASGAAGSGTATTAATTGGTWVEVEETRQINGVYHLGRKDEQMFQDSSEGFLERIHVDSYVSQFDRSVRGVQIRGVDSEVARSYGVQAGDVLLSVNGEQVRTKAEAVNVVKKQYNRGTRTFVGRFLTSTGQVTERTYQAPDK